MNIKRMIKGSLLTAALIGCQLTFAQTIIKPSVKSATSFAIVVDKNTYDQAKNEVDAYRNAIEQEGLGTYIVYHNWSNPEEIKTILQKFYNEKQKLEGTVLVGDIPIPMLRDAQHLTSTLKINQKIRWDRSSVPSDRFYDDFNLKFNFLKQDTVKTNYFYYSLAAESPQRLQPSIYSARIKPPIEEGEDPIPAIKRYLQKVVRLKKDKNPLDQMVVSTGHGYNSNSLNSWAGEAATLKSQFPSLFTPGNSIKFLNFRNSDFMKHHLLTELQREGLDFAFMTGHGTTTLQLINGYPLASNPQPSMANVARYLRSKVRAAKEDNRDVNQVKENFKNSLGVSDKWMDDAFEQSTIDSDSVFNDNLDVQIRDLKNGNIKARLAYLNSCLTGSFQLDNYLAGHYPFSQGDNIAVIANSVGVLQDLWSTELMGILQHGVRVGNWFKHIVYLETHIIGDPTFSFASDNKLGLNDAIGTGSKPASYWKSLLKENDADLQSLALVYLARAQSEKEISPMLKQVYFSSPYESTRTQAYHLLRKYDNEDFLNVLHAARNDSYEFLRRRAAYDICDYGGDEFIKDIIDLYVSDSHSERIVYKIRWTLPFLNYQLVKEEVDKQVRNNPAIYNRLEIADNLDRIVDYATKKVAEAEAVIANKNEEDKKRIGEITTLRAYRYHQLIPAVLKEAKDNNNSDALRIAALEALSWFPLSYQRQTIFDTCQEIIEDNKSSEEVKYQALKTENIMKKI